MRRSLLVATAALLAFASPAMALKITNLDTVPHRVSYDVTGQRLEREIAPNATTRFDGLPNGRLSLLSSPNPKQGGTLNANGLLSGYIGNGRDQAMPVYIDEEYVIWPGGKLQLQRRMKRYGRD